MIGIGTIQRLIHWHSLHIYPIEVLHTRYVTKRDLQRENFFFYKDRSEIIKKYFTI